jgi:ribonuclease HII
MSHNANDADLLIIGVDEVGRGCLAGPVAACAFVFHNASTVIPGLKDSKKLNLKQREALEPILLEAGRHGYGEASAAEIDAIGINPANFLAMQRAIDNLGITSLSGYRIIVDGNQMPPLDHLGTGAIECIVKADDLVPAVSAASVLAKVRRDRFMLEAADRYPGYGFESHAGYGTAAHIAAIMALGPCPLHRMTFAPIAKRSGKKTVRVTKQEQTESMI